MVMRFHCLADTVGLLAGVMAKNGHRKPAGATDGMIGELVMLLL